MRSVDWLAPKPDNEEGKQQPKGREPSLAVAQTPGGSDLAVSVGGRYGGLPFGR